MFPTNPKEIVFSTEGGRIVHELPSEMCTKGKAWFIIGMELKAFLVEKKKNLYCTYNLGLTEALCGFEFTLKQLDGRDLVIRNPPGAVIEPGSTRCVMGEGMPIYRNPFEKGNLFIKFDVTFPPNKFAPEPGLKALEHLLPPRSDVKLPTGEHVEEVTLSEYDPRSKDSNSRREAYHDDSDDDEPGARRVQCANQ